MFSQPPGDRAGRLIEAAGARVSARAAPGVGVARQFIVNVDGANACDVSSLLARVHRAVRDAFDVDLQLEVHLVGEFVAHA